MPKSREQRIADWIGRWKPRLLLDHYSVLTTFASKDKAANVEGLKTLAEMVVCIRYTEARLTIYPAFFKEPTGNQRSTLVHELCHLHTEPVAELMDQAIKKGAITEKAKLDVWESLTEQVAKVCMKAYSGKSLKRAEFHL